jgi:hypothetical protein
VNAAELASRIPGSKQVRAGYMAPCPAHEDKEPSLAFTDGREGVVLKCHAGCTAPDICKAIGLTVRDLFHDNGSRPPPPRKATSTAKKAAQVTHKAAKTEETGKDSPAKGEGYTLEQYAHDRGLPLDFLKGLGLSTMNYMQAAAVRIPYRNRAGFEAAVRFRIAAKGDKFRWRSGSKPLLYGLDNLKQGEAVILVEGESDTHTLLANGYNALGVPGASNWREERDTEHFAGAPIVYVIIEPDAGGEAVKKWLAVSSIRERVKLVHLGEHKDASGLYLDNPAQFNSRMDKALADAVSWSTLEAEERRKAHEEAGQACRSLSREPDILARVSDVANALGCYGEERNVQIVYLALVSRVFARPVSVAVKGCSSSGKSYLVENVLKLMPPEAFYALTAFSEHALAYGTEPLSHRVLVIYEANGMEGEMQTYLIRSLLSEGCIRYETVEKTSEGLVPRLIEREGPTGLIVTTTKTHLHPENETRLLSLTTTDTAAQTSTILAALANGQQRREPELSEWQALQAWIASGPCEVSIPYAAKLAALVPPVAVRLRRDFSTLLSLIRAHALLHQATREHNAEGEVLATVADYRAVRELVLDLLSAGVESTVPDSVRETVNAVAVLQGEGEEDFEGVSVNAIAKALRLDKASASRRLRSAADRGYLVNLEGRRGRAAKWRTGEPMPDDLVILPEPDALEEPCTVAVKTDRVQTPPPPIAEELELVEAVI